MLLSTLQVTNSLAMSSSLLHRLCPCVHVEVSKLLRHISVIVELDKQAAVLGLKMTFQKWLEYSNQEQLD